MLFSCNSFAQQPTDTLVFERIKYLQDLKNFIAKRVWKGFENEKVTQIYFSDSLSYLFNASPKVLDKIKTPKNQPIKDVEMFKTKRIDEKPFHMETATESKDSTVLYFHQPIVMYNDFDSTKKTITNLQSLQEWASMVVHEVFHGYQMQHSITFNYSNQVIYLRGRQIQQLHTEQSWFAESVKNENDLLITLLDKKSEKEMREGLRKYIALREKRQKRAETILPDFRVHENFYEKIEGSAKYVELSLLENFRYFPTNKFLLEKDACYKAEAYQKFRLKEEPWLYDSQAIYYYSTGYNLLRVLDKLKILYKRDFFNISITPYELLKNNIIK